MARGVRDRTLFRRARKQMNKKRNVRGRGKRSLGYGTRVIRYKPGLARTPLPPEFQTQFIASAFMYSSTGVGTGDYIFNFKMNSIYLPFQNAAPSGVTYNTINVATYLPAGYNTLLNANAYLKYLVRGVKIEFDCLPQSVTDPVSCAITCSRTGSVPASLGAALSKPWTKHLAFSSSKQYKMGDYPLKMYVPIHKFLGIPKFMYENDPSGQWLGQYNTDATNTLELVTLVETGDNSVLSNPLEFRVRITYYVTLRELITESLTT